MIQVDKRKTKIREMKEQFAKKKYIYAVGRRKEAAAQVRLYKNGSGKIVVNGKNAEDYLQYFEFKNIVHSSLGQVGQSDKLDVSVLVKGGGKRGQAESIRHGISRALIQLNPNFQRALRKVGFLTRDSRVKERKKPGLKRARRAPQWAKR